MGGLAVRQMRWLSRKSAQLLGFLGVSTLCGVLAAASAVPLVGALAFATNTVARRVTQFPADLKIPSLNGRTYVYDRTGGLIATFFTQNRVYVPLRRISPVMRQAIVDIEDERFYSHGAADLRGTLRALVSNSQGGSPQGASTLTQQYVKNILINQATMPAALTRLLYNRTYAEKLRELQYSIALEQKLTKQQILEGYLNIAPFGRTVYGIEAASEYYFDTTADRLTLPQAAMLAGEVQAPSEYDPTAGGAHIVQAITRRNVVLAKMWSLHHISATAYRAAVRSPLAIHRTEPKQGCSAAAVSQWYCDYIQKTLLNDPAFSLLGNTSAARSARIDAGGLKIYTALDPAVQRMADAGMAAATDPTDTPIVSTTIVKPGTGDVLAVSNSKNYGTDTRAGQSMNDYAVPYRDGNSIGFQPGSGMKPITVAVALEHRVGLDYRITAASGLYYRAFPYYNCAGQDVAGGTSQILNEGGQSYGSITMLQGLWESVNSYFAQLESKVGLCPVARLAGRLGVTTVSLAGGTHSAPLLQVPTLTLGTNVTSPLQMSEVYATLADHGLYCPPRVITKITEAGRALYDQGPACVQVIPRGVADAIDWALYHNVQGDLDPASTAHPAQVFDSRGVVIPTGGKTGTTDNHQAVWYNGFNGQFAASVAVAMPTITGSVNDQSIGGVNTGSATGGRTAGRIWLAIMTPILEAQTAHPAFPLDPAPVFRAPVHTTAPARGSVPGVVGATPAAAEAAIVAAGFSWIIAAPVDSTIPAGAVASTDPAAGTVLPPGSAVTLHLSTGHPPNPAASPTPSR